MVQINGGKLQTLPPSQRLAYDLARETLLLEDLNTRLQLPATNAETKLRKIREEKRTEIWTDFYSTDAMTNRSWTGPNIKLRSVITRLAVHGFHHKLCAFVARPDRSAAALALDWMKIGAPAARVAL
ncbi:hypothetical protein ANN_01252 [Periplaneta americana]|uniref:Uncharacterized protein n=1 Tax=Periplaneta americana TaxID=6978 RepID=A0ABQ8TT22_PERAM|nr:hypothetical protein ANN_01252 [Periplaneta americana]